MGFTARFVPSEAFATVERLFREEREMSERADFDADVWQMQWEAIWARGVALVLSDGSVRERDFAAHAYDDGTARFRYEVRRLHESSGMTADEA